LMWVLENDRSKVEKIEKDMSIARHVMWHFCLSL
jgi:hypothetical protein